MIIHKIRLYKFQEIVLLSMLLDGNNHQKDHKYTKVYQSDVLSVVRGTIADEDNCLFTLNKPYVAVTMALPTFHKRVKLQLKTVAPCR